MKKIRSLVQSMFMLLALGSAAYTSNLRAEDIDIYLDNASQGEIPNVLFVLDNSSNLGSTWGGGGCRGYADGSGAPSMGTNTAGGIIQCALVDTLNGLPNGRLNVGIMVGNANGYATTRGCLGKDGGCLLNGLTLVGAGTREAMISFIKKWINSNAGETATTFPFTVTGAPAGGMMQEAWAYFNGRTGLSGRSYNTDILQNCQKNFIIYIGNTDKTPSNEDLSGPTALRAAGGTGTLLDKITTTQVFKPDPGICGPKQIGSKVAGTNANDWSSNWGDEWARLMLKQDGGTADMVGMQNVKTYTIGIIDNNSNQCTADYPALLQSMAVEGGGKAYRVSDAGEVKDAIAEALNEVQAVNSVFSSASLPVSVNAEGSYLNQIFLGMFRPDTSGAPRWVGNLKQYQLFRNNTGNLVLGDATPCASGTGYCPKSAISSGGTGFLAPNALSFWTYRDEAVAPDSPEVGGFFVRDQKGTPLTSYDYPPPINTQTFGDGEVVEKGGVAQQLRKQNLFATFTGASGATGNPRRVYTYCPSGASTCNDDLTHADNDFATTNASIAAATFGSTVTIPITSIVRNGTTAVVTTAGNHGFTSTSRVTIRNSLQPEYNKQQAPITDVTQRTFTISGLPDYPTTPSTAAYTVSVPGMDGTFNIASVSRTSSATTGSASETVTVTTSANHPYLAGQTVQISGLAEAQYNGNKLITTVPGTTQFTFSVPIYPVSPALNTYQFSHVSRSMTMTSITPGAGAYEVQTDQVHGFHVGQTVRMTNVKGRYSSDYSDRLYTVTSVTSDRIFKVSPPPTSPGSVSGSGSVAPVTDAKTAASVTRNGTTVATTATVTGMPARWFSNGDEVAIAVTGTNQNEGAYTAVTRAVISCTGDCTSFTYAITATPAINGSGAGQVSIPGGGATATISAGNITRVGARATARGIPAGLFASGSVVNISPASGTLLETEKSYVGSWQITCTDSTCVEFSFGNVALLPQTPATGTSMQAFSDNTAPDKNSMITWLRGQDNQGDELGPQHSITVRPSVHGDVLHSRPLVINYGDRRRGIVVFYGSNDGVYRAINGNQDRALESGGITVPAGGELWGLILPEHYQLINRYRANTPELKFPGTFLSTALPKDYFVDGPTGVYQKLDTNNQIERAIIYLTMRRGGRFIYAIDVTEPLSPRVLWSRSHQSAGFEEMGQTWSRPRLTLLQNYYTTTNNPDGTTSRNYTPVLVFGAGYDPAQDVIGGSDTSLSYSADTMGRGIFVINAIDGTKVFSASASCADATANCRKVPEMKYATPSDIAFVDRDLNGLTDKFYWGDLGGNVWRADVAGSTVGSWTVNRVAALGCNTGECNMTSTPRKFFFPPSVLSVRPAGVSGSYDILSLVSGDREHPLRDDGNSRSSYNVNDRFFMIKDMGTTPGVTAGNTVDVTVANLFNATYTQWDGSANGFFINFIGAGWNPETEQPDASRTVTAGEKAVNAPVAVNGQIFFATNQPRPRDSTCSANLGTARAYAVNPFTGQQAQNELDGGGLPPSAVTGLITITETDGNGNQTTTQEKFCIGCGLSGSETGGNNDAPCTSALENCNAGTAVPRNLKRTYWYRK